MSVAKILKSINNAKICRIHTSFAQLVRGSVEFRGPRRKVWRYTWFNFAYIHVKIMKSDQILALRRAVVLWYHRTSVIAKHRHYMRFIDLDITIMRFYGRNVEKKI